MGWAAAPEGTVPEGQARPTSPWLQAVRVRNACTICKDTIHSHMLAKPYRIPCPHNIVNLKQAAVQSAATGLQHSRDGKRLSEARWKHNLPIHAADGPARPGQAEGRGLVQVHRECRRCLNPIFS